MSSSVLDTLSLVKYTNWFKTKTIPHNHTMKQSQYWIKTEI